MNQNGRSAPPIPSVPGGVPIIGQEVYMACSRGHVERVAGPFTMIVPGTPPTSLHICRVCWINFVAMFGARPLDADEIAELHAAEARDRD